MPFLTLRRSCRGITSSSLVWVGLVLSATNSLAQQRTSTIVLEVDATTIARKILHAHESFSLDSQPARTVDLVYPKWIPGNHAPTGPVADLVNLTFTANGRSVPWARDPADMYRFHIQVPEGTSLLVADFSLVGAYAAGNDFGIGNTSTPVQGDVNWDQVVLYPAGDHRRPGNRLGFDQASRALVLRYCVTASVAAGWKHPLRSRVPHHADRFASDVWIDDAGIRHHA